MTDCTGGSCPRHETCEFYVSVCQSPLLRIKYATMFPYCRGGRHESCMRWFLLEQGKPVPEDLLPDGGTDVSLAHGGRPAVQSKNKVLVADDLPLFRRSLAMLVFNASGGGCEIVEASSAEEALEILTRDPTGWLMVVTDYNMAELTGYDLVMRLRLNPALVGVPVIVFSSETDQNVVGRVEMLPRVRWLVKQPNQEPFDAAWNELVRDLKA